MKLRVDGRLLAASVVVACLASSAVALAGSGDTIKVKAPHSAKVKVRFHFTATGRTAAPNRVFTEFINHATKCEQTYKRELSSPFGKTEQEVVRKKAGPYKVHGRVTNFFAGTYYICLYLIDSKASGKTVARASSKYNVT